MYVRQMPDGICLSSDRRINSDKRVRGDVRMNILFISLGCDKNLVDSEVMLGLWMQKDIRL